MLWEWTRSKMPRKMAKRFLFSLQAKCSRSFSSIALI